MEKGVTIYSKNANGQERYTTVRESQVAKRIKMLQNQGELEVRVVNV